MGSLPERDVSCERATADDLIVKARDTARIHRLIAEIRAVHAENDKLRSAVPIEPTGRYCVPQEAGLASEASAVGRRIGKILDALGTLNRWIASGPIVDDCDSLAFRIREKLRADGWRIKVNTRDCWTVLPPK